MVKTRFTPGPWRVIHSPVVADEFGKGVANTAMIFRSVEVNKSNCHLISTAPEMYFVLLECEEILDAMDIGDEPIDEPERKVFERVKMILKKARGEENP